MKRASVVFFYFGEDSYMKQLAQETMVLRPALDRYGHSVLLHHETSVAGLKVSNSDAKWASVVVTPTKENLVAQLNRLGDEGYAVDLFIFSHGWPNRFRTSKGTYGDNEYISAAYLDIHCTLRTLRSVWQCNCYGATLNATWKKLGAEVSGGPHSVNFYPTRFQGFIQSWMSGFTFAQAVTASDSWLVRQPVQTFMLADAAQRLSEWGGKWWNVPFVLGSGKPAQQYFQACWLGPDWVNGDSGIENMRQSSQVVLLGDSELKWQSN